MRLLYRAQSSEIDDDLSSPARRLRPQGRRFVACVLSLGLSTLANVVAAGIRPDPENPQTPSRTVPTVWLDFDHEGP